MVVPDLSQIASLQTYLLQSTLNTASFSRRLARFFPASACLSHSLLEVQSSVRILIALDILSIKGKM